MKRAAMVLVGAVIAFTLVSSVLSRRDRSRKDTSPEPEGSYGGKGYAMGIAGGNSDTGPTKVGPKAVPTETTEDTPPTTEQFQQLSQEEQDAAISEYVAAFWETEAGSPEREHEKEYVPLDIFARPYMMTVTEREFAELSPEDQEKLLDETAENLRELRTESLNTVALAQESTANGHYVEAEAYLISVLETGRELNGNKKGLLVTRLVGMAHQKAALNEMVRLYTKTDQHSKLSIAQEELQSIEAEKDEIRRIAAEQQQ